MKSKKDDFTQFKTKIFLRILSMGIVTVSAVYCFYLLFLKGRFGNWVVALLQKFLRLDYYVAMAIYDRAFRANIELIILLTIAVVFLIALRISLNWFTKYFSEINRGIDSLVNETGEDITLSPELSSVENKLNSIRHTLAERKKDAKLAEQRKNDLVMYLAHDLKTPLSSVIGYLTLLRDEQKISEELRTHYLSITLEKAERLEDLINEFFEITRFNLSNITLEYGKISLTRMLEQLVYEFLPMLAEKNLDCVLKAEPDLQLKCDADKLQRVFDNLLRNAVNYSYENTKIYVTAARTGENVLLKFTNEGNTISTEKLERIFEQFFRLDTARSSSSGGAAWDLRLRRRL